MYLKTPRNDFGKCLSGHTIRHKVTLGEICQNSSAFGQKSPLFKSKKDYRLKIQTVRVIPFSPNFKLSARFGDRLGDYVTS